MKNLEELLSPDSAFALISEWAVGAWVPVEILPPAATRSAVLLTLQVTTHSLLGAVGYETGGILIDHGWLRILGSGHPRLARTLPSWNKDRADGFYLVADDAGGGFFAINGGALGTDLGKTYYFAQDRLAWEPMGLEYSQFLFWCMSERLEKFYEDVRWTSWVSDVSLLHGDRCYSWFPPRWTKEGKASSAHRGEIPVAEAWSLGLDFKKQLDGV